MRQSFDFECIFWHQRIKDKSEKLVITTAAAKYEIPTCESGGKTFNNVISSGTTCGNFKAF
jgi:hypothetical protein